MSSSVPPHPPARKIRVGLADDHPVVRAGVRAILKAVPGVVVVGEAADGQATLEMIQQLAPDILLLDLEMPHRTGLDVLHALQEAPWRGRTILLVGRITREQTLVALQGGVAGLLLKADAADHLVDAVQAVASGWFWIDGRKVRSMLGVIAELLSSAQVPTNRFGLTSRELDVIRLVVDGQSNREIAESLRIAEETVKQHIKNAFDKTGVSRRLELALFAIDHGLVTR